MFRKLVSNLPYSPALIADVGFYAKRLRDEDVTRRVTVLFVVLAMIMQSLALFSPPESANASSEQDIIRGGVSNLNDFLTRYDNNEDDVKDIYTAAGITRSEIAAARPGKITASDNTYIMSRYGQLSSGDKEVTLTYQRSAGGVGVRYFSPLAAMSDSSEQAFKGWTGKSAALGWFGIAQASGSLAVHGIPTTLSTLGAGSSEATQSVTARNITQDTPAEKVTAQPLDKIAYTIRLSNPRSISVNGSFKVRISDVLEYSELIDNGGGNLDKTSATLSWPAIELGPGQSQERTFVVQLFSHLPATGAGSSNPESFDCKLTVVFGTVSGTSVACPDVKGIEAILYQLPTLGTGANILFMSIILIVVLFFAIRTRQLKKEIRIIRHNFNTGII